MAGILPAKRYILTCRSNRDVGDLDADVFWSVQGGVEVEVLEIKDGKGSLTLREYTIDEEFDKFK